MTKFLSEDSWQRASIPITEDRDSRMKYLNKWGYQCGDLSITGAVNVLSIGCSWTQGSHIIPSFTIGVCEKLSGFLDCEVKNFNLGMGGRSVDYITRTLLCSVDTIQPDFVIICFTGLYRREYHNAEGRRFKWFIDWISEAEKNGRNWRALSEEDKQTVRYLNGLLSPYDDTVNFMKNYKLIELLLEKKKIPWGFSMISAPPTIASINELLDAGWLDRSRYIGIPFEAFDHVSETDSHPGKESVAFFTDRFSEWIIQNHGDHLKRAASSSRPPRAVTIYQGKELPPEDPANYLINPSISDSDLLVLEGESRDTETI